MPQSKENHEWVENIRPDITEIAEHGILLKEFNRSARHPSVYLIWEIKVGKIDKIGIVCICSTLAVAKWRVKGMNQKSFWKDTDFTEPTRCQDWQASGRERQVQDTYRDGVAPQKTGVRVFDRGGYTQSEMFVDSQETK